MVDNRPVLQGTEERAGPTAGPTTPFGIGMCRVMLYVQVAACVCLFSLDKHAAIPVDTHVWQLAVRYYTPHLKGVSMWQHRKDWPEIACSARFTAGLNICLL